MLEQIEGILKEAHQIKEQIKTLSELEKFRIKFLGRRGLLSVIADGLKNLDQEERKKIGKQFNLAKTELNKIYGELKNRLYHESKIKFSFYHPGKKPLVGHRHPLTHVLHLVKKIFIGMGFTIIDSPEIENEYYNFDSLNIPKNHPARDLWDTIWVKEGQNTKIKNQRLLFRTHTSAYQVKFMQKQTPPFRVVIPGKCFRYEATDKTHDFEFFQFDALSVSSHSSLAELRGTLEQFFTAFFEKSLKVRLRPSYFPFVEPGLEVDIQCIFCSGKNKAGCSICKYSGFIEIAGAGMIHPYVLRQSGISSREHFGWAFGLGIERLTMLKYRIDDIRLFRSNDIRFIHQFS
jgi:phenylalanyl-tRNA synthetase alpha chain